MSKSLSDSVTVLKGVGSKRAEALNRLKINTIFDLLTYFPFRYEDLRVQDIHLVIDQQKVVLEGHVINEPSVRYFGKRKSRLVMHLEINQIIVPVIFFNQPYLANQIHNGDLIQVFGTWDGGRGQLIAGRLLKTEDHFEPVYPASKDIKAGTIRQLITQAYAEYEHLLPSNIFKDIFKKYDLLSFSEAIKQIHFPSHPIMMEKARQSLIFLEFLLYQLKLLLFQRHEKSGGKRLAFDKEALQDFSKSLEFELTAAQKRVINEICRDFLMPFQMFRLLQGDVGSGKTVVAASAIFAAWTAGKQSAIMAPTEILAQQHAQTLEHLYQDFGINLALLTSSTKTSKRKEILEHLALGEIDCIIGTHALIQNDVLFKDLQLVIIDEQHRFGVSQRRTLREKGNCPDVLFMTATPIPRTLSISAFGQMDISILDELPKGRQPVKTYWIKSRQMPELVQVMERHISQGHQIYIVSPLIEESEFIDSDNAEELIHEYRKLLNNDISIELLHGRMTPDEKNQVMERFEFGQTQVLVSTTVIEVGVDIPNATLMIIHGADRFGLAQLHQLRGRIGRGSGASECYLISDTEGKDGKKRMKLMTETNDGFMLSQKDLEMRGPGQFFGVQQSGIPIFKIADLVQDQDALEVARYEAKKYLSENSLKDLKDQLPEVLIGKIEKFSILD